MSRLRQLKDPEGDRNVSYLDRFRIQTQRLLSEATLLDKIVSPEQKTSTPAHPLRIASPININKKPSPDEGVEKLNRERDIRRISKGVQSDPAVTGPLSWETVGESVEVTIPAIYCFWVVFAQIALTDWWRTSVPHRLLRIFFSTKFSFKRKRICGYEEGMFEGRPFWRASDYLCRRQRYNISFLQASTFATPEMCTHECVARGGLLVGARGLVGIWWAAHKLRSQFPANSVIVSCDQHEFMHEDTVCGLDHQTESDSAKSGAQWTLGCVVQAGDYLTTFLKVGASEPVYRPCIPIIKKV